MLQHLDCEFEIKSLQTAKSDKGHQVHKLTAYASVFDRVDYVGDVVKKGAFTETLSNKRKDGRSIPMLWQHSPDKPIGKWVEWSEDDHGLLMSGELTSGMKYADEAFLALQHGTIDGISIGYEVIDSEVGKHDGDEVLFLKKLELWEASVVTFPAMKDARIVAVKQSFREKLSSGKMPTPSEFEMILRDAGFTRKKATQVCSKGYTHLWKDHLRDADNDADDAADIVESIKNLTEILKCRK